MQRVVGRVEMWYNKRIEREPSCALAKFVPCPKASNWKGQVSPETQSVCWHGARAWGYLSQRECLFPFTRPQGSRYRKAEILGWVSWWDWRIVRVRHAESGLKGEDGSHRAECLALRFWQDSRVNKTSAGGWLTKRKERRKLEKRKSGTFWMHMWTRVTKKELDKGMTVSRELKFTGKQAKRSKVWYPAAAQTATWGDLNCWCDRHSGVV